MDLIGMIILGAILGGLARLVMPGRQPIGVLLTIVAGALGAIGGNYLGEAISPDGTMHWILSVISAIVVVSIIVAATGRRTV